MAEEQTIRELEKIFRSQIKSKSLTDEAFIYMAKIVNEDSPKNSTELASLLVDFITDGMVYQEEEAIKLCENIMKIIFDQKLL